jgi:hypothetical protein
MKAVRNRNMSVDAPFSSSLREPTGREYAPENNPAKQSKLQREYAETRVPERSRRRDQKQTAAVIGLLTTR